MKKTVRGRRKDSGGPLESIFSDILRTACPLTTILETPRLLFRRLGATFRGRTARYYGQELELFQLERRA
jgi:hypothetical protein